LFSTWQLPGRRYAKENGIPYLTEFHTDYYNFSSTYPAGKWVRDLSFKPLMNYLYRQCDTTIVSSKFGSSTLHKIGVFNDEVVFFVGLMFPVITKSSGQKLLTFVVKRCRT
jgi:hypothetical protein